MEGGTDRGKDYFKFKIDEIQTFDNRYFSRKYVGNTKYFQWKTLKQLLVDFYNVYNCIFIVTGINFQIGHILLSNVVIRYVFKWINILFVYALQVNLKRYNIPHFWMHCWRILDYEAGRGLLKTYDLQRGLIERRGLIGLLLYLSLIPKQDRRHWRH